MRATEAIVSFDEPCLYALRLCYVLITIEFVALGMLVQFLRHFIVQLTAYHQPINIFNQHPKQKYMCVCKT